MFEISVQPLNVDQLARQFSYLGREGVCKWVAVGMTQTAKESTQDVRHSMPMYIDKPTPWTMRSLFFFPAEKDDLRAAVAFKWEFGRRSRKEIGLFDAPQALQMQVYGGGRKLKDAERTLQRAGVSPPGKPFLVPSVGAELDQYGNVRRGFMNKVLYSRSRGGSADMQPLSGGARKSRSRDSMAGIRHFVPKNKKGIYRTVPHSRLDGSRGRGGIIPVFLFSAQPHYSERFDFHGIANRGASGLIKNVDNAIDRGVRRYLGV